jgi:cytochrome c oxidase subunit 1
MPQWMLWLGQIISYLSGIPVLLVTMIGTLTIIHKSGIKWDAASSLLVLSVFGWAAGVLPAIIDATIVVNMVMHNTMWVPGHFHFYLLLGMIAMAFGFMFYLGKAERNREDGAFDRLAVWIYAGGGLTFVFAFLMSGAESVPRRWAVHLPEWMPYDRYGAVCAAVVVLASVWFLVRYISSLWSPVEVRAEATQEGN